LLELPEGEGDLGGDFALGGEVGGGGGFFDGGGGLGVGGFCGGRGRGGGVQRGGKCQQRGSCELGEMVFHVAAVGGVFGFCSLENCRCCVLCFTVCLFSPDAYAVKLEGARDAVF
jgi:hypothetical protein